MLSLCLCLRQTCSVEWMCLVSVAHISRKGSDSPSQMQSDIFQDCYSMWNRIFSMDIATSSASFSNACWDWRGLGDHWSKSETGFESGNELEMRHHLGWRRPAEQQNLALPQYNLSRTLSKNINFAFSNDISRPLQASSTSLSSHPTAPCSEFLWTSYVTYSLPRGVLLLSGTKPRAIRR